MPRSIALRCTNEWWHCRLTRVTLGAVQRGATAIARSASGWRSVTTACMKRNGRIETQGDRLGGCRAFTQLRSGLRGSRPQASSQLDVAGDTAGARPAGGQGWLRADRRHHQQERDCQAGRRPCRAWLSGRLLRHARQLERQVFRDPRAAGAEQLVLQPEPLRAGRQLRDLDFRRRLPGPVGASVPCR